MARSSLCKRVRGLIVFLSLVMFPSVSSIGWAQTGESPAWTIGADLNTSLYISPRQEGIGSTTFGPGLNLKIHVSVHPIYSLGFLLENFWLYPDRDPWEFDVTQQHYLLLNRFRLLASPVELSAEAGMGVAIYHGMVDIPEKEGCWGCGRYGDSSYQCTFHVGVFLLVPLNRFLFLQGGVRYMHNFGPLKRSTDVHNFIPTANAIGIDAGIAVRL